MPLPLLQSPAACFALTLSAFGAGAMNALAGGGTLLTFPTLLLLGESSIVANATSTVALVPASAASLLGYRREVATHGAWLRALALPSLLGGITGAVLLLRTPEAVFARLAPLLVLFATTLFALQTLVARAGPSSEDSDAEPRRFLLSWLCQFAVAVYGGYFGAGMGILMLVVLGFLGLTDIHAMNGLKNFFGICINGVAAIWFVTQGAVDWPAALVMVAGATAGGYAGARFARHIGREQARRSVIAIGVLSAITLLLRQ